LYVKKKTLSQIYSLKISFPQTGLKNRVCWVLRIQELLEHLFPGFAAPKIPQRIILFIQVLIRFQIHRRDFLSQHREGSMAK